MAPIKVKKLVNKKDWNAFLKLPWKIYKDDPFWVPPLLFELKRQLDPSKNPFFDEAKVEYWIAWKEGECVGRIAGIVNYFHNKFHQDKVGYFGYFESINDSAVSSALLSEVGKWLKENGLEEMQGPVNLTTANESGLLIEGFDRSPILQMTYNPGYYIALYKDYGLTKEMDLLAFYITDEILKDEKLLRKLDVISRRITQKEHISFRTINLKNYAMEMENVRHLFNDFMSDNWGFVPFRKKEFEFVADSLKQILIKDLTVFAEVDGKPVGFSIALPDFNFVLKKMNGKLLPTGIFKFLWYKNRIPDIRVMLMGISKAYRKKGLEVVFYNQTIIEGSKRNFTGAELSWVTEENQGMIGALEKLKARLYKRYRVYKVDL